MNDNPYTGKNQVNAPTDGTAVPHTDEGNNARAVRLWNDASKINGTPAAAYLLRRKIMPNGDTMDALRYLEEGGERMLLGAVRAWNNGQPGEAVAIQRIYLTPTGEKSKDKYTGESKKTLGTQSDAAGNAAFWLMPGVEPAVICEGIDDALAVRMAYFSKAQRPPTVVATLGVGRFTAAAKAFPGAIFLPDAEAEAIAKAHAAAHACGGKVVLLPNVAGAYGCGDANELLAGACPDAVLQAIAEAVEPVAPVSRDDDGGQGKLPLSARATAARGMSGNLPNMRNESRPEDVARALREYWNADDYDDWATAALALHDFPDGKAIWLAWARTSAKFNAAENERKWRDTVPSRGISARSILGRVPPAVLSDWGRQHAAARKLECFKVEQQAKDDSGGTTEVAPVTEEDAEARRERQREENRAIGDGVVMQTTTEAITLADAIARFVLVSDGSRVVDIDRPIFDWAFPDFAATYSASTEPVVVDRKVTNVPISKLWKSDPRRLTTFTRTFAPGRDRFTVDPRGLTAINTWHPYIRPEPSDHHDRHVELFHNHVYYLFAEDTERFLDWLAHIEQEPGVLPHTAWLRVSEKTGTGRNALAGILTRIWRGHVAASLDLMGVLKSGFNGQLSSKLLAVVDEIREGGRDYWEHSQRLKSLITEEQRTINPKYGRQSVEFNCCRFLLLSNHRMALPIDENDRRFEAVICAASPMSEAYYAELYARIDKPDFINDVALWLGQRNLAQFKPGRRALATAAKVEVARASESEGMSYARQLVEHWPADVVPSRFAASVINPDYTGQTSGPIRAIMADAGIVSYGLIKFEGSPMRVSILRNASKWKDEPPASLARELRRGGGNFLAYQPRDVLDSLIAEAAHDGRMERR